MRLRIDARVRRALTAVSAAVLVVGGAVPREPASASGVSHESAQPSAAPDSSDWLADAERSIAEREYEATDNGVGLQAPNRAQDLRTYFEADGARVVSREDDASQFVRLRTVALGRDDALRALSTGEVASDGARVTIRREGIEERYDNSERGLEQTWTVDARPDGSGPLVVEVATGAESVRVDGATATLTAGGRRLEYGGLAARDARGQALAASMEAAGDDRLRIVVDDRSAAYPVTIDPILTTPPYALVVGAQASAYIGSSVASAGDVNGDGYADVIVGAPNYDNGQTDEGAAFVFLGGPNGIAGGDPSNASAILESNQADAGLGFSVASAGDVNGDGYADVIVGAPFFSNGQTGEGIALVFVGSPAGIQSGTPGTASALLQSDQANAYMGYSVASAGDVNGDGYADVVVGASAFTSTQSFEGAAFVFLGSATGIHNGTPSSANTTLRGAQASIRFGWSVASTGDVNHDGYADLIVGAPYYSGNGLTNEGGAFVFLGSPSGVPNGTTGTASAVLQSDQAGASLGVSVASAGDVNHDGYADVIVGAYQYDGDGVTDEGAAFVFLGSATGIHNGTPQTASAVLQSDQGDSLFGGSVASAGDVNGDGYADVLVGADNYFEGATRGGAAFVFLGGPNGVPNGNPATASAVVQPDQAGAALGASVASAGDVNGDGYSDVIVGASGFTSTRASEGAALVYLGGPDGLSAFPAASAVVSSNQADANLGYSVAGAGDVNGDGYADIIVGARGYDDGLLLEGAAFVCLGGPNGIATGNPSTASAVLHGGQVNVSFGASVAGAGDVNGDGYADIIVGAPAYSHGQSNEGAAFVFLGGPSGIASGTAASASALLEPDQAGAGLGSSVASAGDVNNDGYSDVIVGAPYYDHTLIDAGAAFVFLGSSTGVHNGTPATANAILESYQTNARLGSSVAGAGDVNGDGYADVIVGAPNYNDGQSFEGVALVFLGSSSGIHGGEPATANTVLHGGQANAYFGLSVAGAGDFNGDGYADVIVGAPSYTTAPGSSGAAFIFPGSAFGIVSGSATGAYLTLEPDQADAGFGYSVASAGDINGDGHASVVVGATAYGTPAALTAFVFNRPQNRVSIVFPKDAAATLATHVTDSSFGMSVAGAGDTNGDGYADVIVGAPTYTAGESHEGGAFVYLLRRRSSTAGTDTAGVYQASSGTWFLKNANAPGPADLVFTYGAGGQSFVALRGDWDGDGVDTPGLYVPSSGFFFLKNSNSPGPADLTFQFGVGNAGYVPIVGDWNGDGVDTVGLYQPATGFFFLKNTNTGGAADLSFQFGLGGLGYAPVAGDWDGDGVDTVGLYAPSSGYFFLKNSNTGGAADLAFPFGPGGLGWKPLAGDFDGDGADTVGIYSPSSGFFFLRNTNTPGPADLSFAYGPPNLTPLTGNWDGQ